MQLRRSYVVTIALLGLGMSLYAEGTDPHKAKPRQHRTAPAVLPNKTALTARAVSPQQVTSTTISEVIATHAIIQPGASMEFDALSDFTGATSASIAFLGDNGQDFTNLEADIYWAIPNANFVVADYLSGGDFAFMNSGGANVATYGNQLAVVVVNNGTKPFTLSQITVYAVAR